jgi:two-component system, chemotaxis family, chemotaxis protein CheY
MSKVLLVGHCGPDSTYLRMAVKSALGNATIIAADDAETLDKSLQQGVDLILFNRELSWGFESTAGVDVIRQLKTKYPQLKMMLISNYPDAQAAAVAAGALPGFGKRQIGSPQATKLLREAMGLEVQP